MVDQCNKGGCKEKKEGVSKVKSDWKRGGNREVEKRKNRIQKNCH